jgi:putative Holliday junction resolvase
MKILAIDFGTKRIGLARWSSEAKVILPFGIINNQDELSKLIKTENFDKIVIGLPLGLNGHGNKNVERVKNFGEELKQKINLPIEFIDERFSSQEAVRMGDGVSLDEKSAMVILNTYINNKLKIVN